MVPVVEEIAAWVWTGGQALTSYVQTVSWVQVLAAVAGACPGGARGVEQMEALTDAVIAAGPAIAVDALHASHHSNTQRWSTRDIVKTTAALTTPWQAWSR